MKWFSRLLFLFSLICVTIAWSHDLGTLGQTYPIKEVDIKLIITKQGEHLPLDKIKADLKNSTVNYFKNLPNFGLTTV